MLTLRQEKLIRSLATTKGRAETGLCLVEGEKNVAEAKDFLDYTFTPQDTKKFNQLVSTITPQAIFPFSPAKTAAAPARHSRKPRPGWPQT